MTTDRDLRNQLAYAIKTNDYDALAGVVADMTTNAYRSGVDYGKEQTAKKIACKMLSADVSREEIAKYTGLSQEEIAALK